MRQPSCSHVSLLLQKQCFALAWGGLGLPAFCSRHGSAGLWYEVGVKGSLVEL